MKCKNLLKNKSMQNVIESSRFLQIIEKPINITTNDVY
jgi:hypothetical protein